MNNQKAPISFDDIIQADRQRRKNEELANEIFGRSRKAKDTNRDQERNQTRTPSLASRVGVAKRSNSSTNVKPTSSAFNPPSRPTSAAANAVRTNRLVTAVNNRQQANVTTSPVPRGPGLSIKGAAGPFAVEAANFAPGTTAADIESALQSIVTDSNGPIEISSCRIVQHTPSVIAEMVFAEKAMADAVIRTFDGQKADGRILRVNHKRPTASTLAPKNEAVFAAEVNTTNVGKDLENSTPDDLATEAMEDVEMATDQTPYSDERDRSDRERRDRDRDRDRDPRREGEEEHSRGEDRNGGRRDERDRDRERDRERDRDRDRDHERDRDRDSRRYDDDRRYDRRDDRSSRGYGPQNAGGGYDPRGGGGGRQFGNGMGGYPRGGGGGGMYNNNNNNSSGNNNEGMMGGGRGGGFRGSGGGGYRGAYRGRGGY